MTFRLHRSAEATRPALGYILPLFLGACLLADVATGMEHSLSDRYAMKVDPAAKQQLGEKTFNEVMAFFQAAEEAIETKNLEALMDLYSEDYSNGGHDKKSVEKMWKRIFPTFKTMATHHNMELVNLSAAKKDASRDTVVFRCSGLLMGVHDPQKGLITIDNWTRQDHVLIREDGKWRLFGTYGRERKRLWFDKPIHPLF